MRRPRAQARNGRLRGDDYGGASKRHPTIMNWVRGSGPGGAQDLVEVYVYGKTRRRDEGQVGHDVCVRPTGSGSGASGQRAASPTAY